MKVRLDFVTNSSSSSYVCDFCGYDVSGWDLCLSEANMYSCSFGHTYCREHAVDFDKKAWVLRMVEEYESAEEAEKVRADMDDDPDLADELAENYEFDYEGPVEMCPICSFQELTTSDMAAYLLKKHDINREALRAELRSRFSTYAEFMKYLRAK